MNTELIQPDIGDLREKISNITTKIMKKRTDIRVDIIYFFLTVVVLIIFVLIVFIDLFNVFKVYIDKQKQIQANNNKLVNDDNDYQQPAFNNQNELEKIEERIYNKHRVQQDNMKHLIDWKKSIDLKNPSKIESQIDLNSLDKTFDDYSYNKQKSGESFFKLLFMPPKYHEVINNEAIPYFKFQNSPDEDIN